MSIENLSSQTTHNETMKPRATMIPGIKMNSLRKRTSLKPRKSLLRVRSLRPTIAVLGKISKEEA